MSERSAFVAIAKAAAPLYVTTFAASVGSLVDTALLGRHATVSLAAFAVTVAVFSPGSWRWWPPTPCRQWRASASSGSDAPGRVWSVSTAA
ncbi:hypothetical protein ABZX77_43460 [Streptomyces sp. NPDC004237]|uniref:hypothetical protein n=1 Tax=Streptomyces sp. NPDC004237 TaxID=3154455 RepID=UPI0033AA10F0